MYLNTRVLIDMAKDFPKFTNHEIPAQDDSLMKKSKLLMDLGQGANKFKFLLEVAGTLVGR